MAREVFSLKGFQTAVASLALGCLLFLLLLFPDSSMQGARDGLLLFGNSVLPALLPFFVLSSLLAQSGLFRSLGLAGRLLGLPFRLGGAAGSVLPLCLLTGVPNSARLTAELCRQGLMHEEEAARLLAAGVLTGPLFLIGTAGALLGSPALGAFVYVVQLLCALLNGLLWRGYGKKGATPAPKRSGPAPSPFQTLPKALSDSCSAILLVGCAVCFFASLARLLADLGFMDALASALSGLFPRQAVSPLVSGALEVSIGCKAVCLASLPLGLRLSLLCGLAGFGGFSILCQSACFLQGIVPMRIYALQRLSHGTLCFILCRFSLLFVRGILPVWSPLAPLQTAELGPLAFGAYLLCALAGLLLRPRGGPSSTSSRR